MTQTSPDSPVQQIQVALRDVAEAEQQRGAAETAAVAQRESAGTAVAANAQRAQNIFKNAESTTENRLQDVYVAQKRLRTTINTVLAIAVCGVLLAVVVITNKITTEQRAIEATRQAQQTATQQAAQAQQTATQQAAQAQQIATQQVAKGTQVAAFDKYEHQMAFVPASSFQMGCSSADTNCSSDEKPLHTVTLDAYQIDTYEVTNGQYAQCVATGKCTPPANKTSTGRSSYYDAAGFTEYPVIYVNWAQAGAFCAWAGERLPTEAEWEKAARGATDTRIYPWGDSNPSCSLANTYGCSKDTDKVGNHPQGASPYGVQDMAGNVWEWTSDWYGDSYYQSSPDHNPTGPTGGSYRVLRGGSWNLVSRFARVSDRGRYVPDLTSDDIGFRCAR